MAAAANGVQGAHRPTDLPVRDRLRDALQGFPLNLSPSPRYDMLPPHVPVPSAPAGHVGPNPSAAEGSSWRKGRHVDDGEVGGNDKGSGTAGRGYGGIGGELRTSFEAGTAPEPAESAEEYSQRLVYVAAKALAVAARGDEATQLGGMSGLADAGKRAVEDRHAAAAVARGDGDGQVVAVDIEGFVPVHEIGMAPLIKLAPLPPLDRAEARELLVAALLSRGVTDASLLAAGKATARRHPPPACRLCWLGCAAESAR